MDEEMPVKLVAVLLVSECSRILFQTRHHEIKNLWSLALYSYLNSLHTNLIKCIFLVMRSLIFALMLKRSSLGKDGHLLTITHINPDLVKEAQSEEYF